MSLNKIVKTNSKKGMRMKKLDIDELRSIAAKTSVHEKRLLRTCLIIVLFYIRYFIYSSEIHTEIVRVKCEMSSFLQITLKCYSKK